MAKKKKDKKKRQKQGPGVSNRQPKKEDEKLKELQKKEKDILFKEMQKLHVEERAKGYEVAQASEVLKEKKAEKEILREKISERFDRCAEIDSGNFQQNLDFGDPDDKKKPKKLSPEEVKAQEKETKEYRKRYFKDLDNDSGMCDDVLRHLNKRLKEKKPTTIAAVSLAVLSSSKKHDKKRVGIWFEWLLENGYVIVEPDSPHLFYPVKQEKPKK